MAEAAENKTKIPMIGLLAVKNLLITKEELQKALSHCSGADNLDLALKEYLLSKEIVSAQNMERLLRASKKIDLRQKEFKFGAVAIRKGFINQSVLKLVLEEQENDIKNKRKVRLIGDMLVEAGMMTEKKEKLKEDNLTLQKQITELAHIQDRSQLEQKELNSKISTLENDTEAVHELQKKIEQLQLAARKAEESLDLCFDKSDKIEAAMANQDREIEGFEKRRADFIDERNNLIKWAKENPGKPVVICEGMIMPETLIETFARLPRFSCAESAPSVISFSFL